MPDQLDFGDKPIPLAGARYQILALSGRGYRGLYTAEILAKCENRFAKPIKDQFDLIAGTSIGALIAAGLATGVQAEKLVATFKKHGQAIFPKGPMTGLRRYFVHAPYRTEALEAAITELLGDNARRKLSEIDVPLLVIAVNATMKEAHLFQSGGLAGGGAADVSLMDAILASAAAPTFFPQRIIGETTYIDGGLVANAPDLLALSEARRLGVRAERIYMLSIGTAGERPGARVDQQPRSPGVLSTISGGLIETIMASQEALAVSEARRALRSRHLRVDQSPSREQAPSIASLDKADEAASRTLLALAAATWGRLENDDRLKDFFAERTRKLD